MTIIKHVFCILLSICLCVSLAACSGSFSDKGMVSSEEVPTTEKSSLEEITTEAAGGTYHEVGGSVFFTERNLDDYMGTIRYVDSGEEYVQCDLERIVSEMWDDGEGTVFSNNAGSSYYRNQECLKNFFLEKTSGYGENLITQVIIKYYEDENTFWYTRIGMWDSPELAESSVRIGYGQYMMPMELIELAVYALENLNKDYKYSGIEDLNLDSGVFYWE